jgi:hypothetical protein
MPQRVFDDPMTASSMKNFLSIVGEVRDIVSCFDGCPVSQLAPAGDHDNGLKTLPMVESTQKLKAFFPGDSPAFANFNTAVLLVNRSMIVMLYLLNDVLMRQLEEQLHILLEIRLVIMYR